MTAEPIDAGYRGNELLDRVARLTGLGDREARMLSSPHAI